MENLLELKNLSVDELVSKILEAKKELLKLRLNLKYGQLKQTHLVKDKRKEIARMRTFLIENLAKQSKDLNVKK